MYLFHLYKMHYEQGHTVHNAHISLPEAHPIYAMATDVTM